MLKRMDSAALTPAEMYGFAWARMNDGVDFAIRENELHYLQTIALNMDDDLASLLLLKKLKLAKVARDRLDDVVGMTSTVTFRFGGGERKVCQLLHPSLCGTIFQQSIASRLGAGLIGLRAGQLVEWPDDDGCPRELQVIDVRSSRVIRHLGNRRSPLRDRAAGNDDLPPSAA